MLYKLQNDQIRYWTGRLPNGNQIIIGPSLPNIVVFFFDKKGKYLKKELIALKHKPKLNESASIYMTDSKFMAAMDGQIAAILKEVSCTPAEIKIQEFFDDEEQVGIQDLPSEFQVFLDNPEAASHEDRKFLQEAIKEFRDEGQFIFLWGGELWMSSEGEVSTS